VGGDNRFPSVVEQDQDLIIEPQINAMPSGVAFIRGSFVFAARSPMTFSRFFFFE
jgi:hypothetical protein